MLNKIKENKKYLIILAILLLIAGVAHGYNMFHFPYYENDEGTYMSQAWALLTQGKLAPYTYWYDHAPAGWMLIASWVKLTGGFFTFGTAVNSGRVLMLVLHLATVSLLFYIAKKLSGGYLAGIIAVLIFSLSPLGIYFQRRVLLDNIMVFWVFLSLALLLKERLKLSQIIASAITFAIAVLTKENAIFFAPVFVYIVYSKSHAHHKSFAIVKWIAVAGLIISIYLLYALLKGEFFPVGFLGNSSPHVSLITTLQEQLSRGTALLPWDKKSDFYVNFLEWLSKDPYTFIVGGVSTIVSAFICIKVKSIRIPVFLALMFWLFLLRGKLVIDFYVVPLIPLLSLNIGMLAHLLLQKASFGKNIVYYFFATVAIFASIYFPLTKNLDQYIRDETTPQIKTIAWIKTNLSQNSEIIIDNSIYVDLHQARFPGDKVFPNADWNYIVEKDPAIRNGKLQDDWKNIQYVVLSHEVLKQIKANNFPLTKNAFDNSFILASWLRGSTSYIDLKNYISTNGDWMSIYKVKDKYQITQDKSWDFYKNNFIKSYGQIVDPSSNNTTSEGQSYALLRAVWAGDKTTFAGVWSWTKDHLQFRTQDKLFSWLWTKQGDKYGIGDSATASDADQDIALSLLFASKKWNDVSYLTAAKPIIDDIWKQEVVKVNDHYYLTSSDGASRVDGYLINPSYLSPAIYRIFAQVDSAHPWADLANDSYFLLNQLGNQSNNQTYLPQNWILIDKVTGEIKSATKYVNDTSADSYGFDAFRTMWRVGLDAVWFNNSDAVKYLEKVSPFLTKEWVKNNKIFSIYDLSGNPKVNFDSLSTNVGALSVFTITDKNLAKNINSKLFDEKFNYDQGYWGDKNNYYDQNWAWFGTALYNNNLSNLWGD